jgi:hypothetical protein
MSAASSAGVLPKALIATLVGSVIGGAVGVWSLRRPAASANATASAVVAPSRATTTTGASAGSSPSTTSPTQVATTTEPRALTNAVAPPAEADPQVLQQARTLARRPDVTALMALRDDVVRRATERGIADSSAVKGELSEIDFRLTEARTLRLKLDAEELRKADSKPH